MKTYEIKKLFNGYASVRDYVVNNCVRARETLQIKYNNKTMTLSPFDLQQKQQHILNKKLTSKFKGEYSLIDYKWISDEEKAKQPNLFAE